MLRQAGALSFAAGVFISIGGAVFLSCENRTVGAVLFSVALLSICYLGLFLFTGKVGFLVSSRKREDVLRLLITLGGNLCGTLVCGLLLSWTKPALKTAAQALCAPKLDLSPLAVAAAALFCGALMYTAVAIYQEKGSPLGILFCVPVFILSGFEHSIADMFYFFAAGCFTPQCALFLALVIFGNALGGLLIPALRKLAEVN